MGVSSPARVGTETDNARKHREGFRVSRMPGFRCRRDAPMMPAPRKPSFAGMGVSAAMATTARVERAGEGGVAVDRL